MSKPLILKKRQKSLTILVSFRRFDIPAFSLRKWFLSHTRVTDQQWNGCWRCASDP